MVIINFKSVNKSVNKNEIKKTFKDMLLLIEDKEFPARRNISDCAELMVMYCDFELGKELQEMSKKFYDRKDNKHLFNN